jgi:beta-lactam-binding protein with PASTA domain/tRNA A-37 threonylcarbamoyl transferase component Bud32
MTDQIGRVLSGRYRLIAPIGSGASALVYLADDTRLRRRVAVKLLHQALAEDEAFLRRFRAEAQSAAALNHPHVLAVYDWGDDEREPYLITEYLGGGSLRGMLDAGHRLTPAQALLVGLEAARGLEYAHTRGFVHRDIKPANLLFGDEGRLRIGDFGLARALAEAAWTEPAGAMLGTARYACPEQARGEPADGKGDVYSLGLVLIEAVTGRVPFATDTTIATLMARVDHPVEVPPELGPLRGVLARAGRPDPAERPDAGEFAVGLLAAAEELERPEPLPLAGATATVGDVTVVDRDPTQLPPFTAAEPVFAGEAGPPAPLVVSKRRRRWPIVLAAVAAVLALTGAAALAWNTVLVPSHKLPQLVGLTEQQAREQIGANHWKVRKLEGRDDNSSPGQVIKQDPAQGASLKEQKTVTITVSLGHTLTPVPDVEGKTVEEAMTILQQANLVLGQQTPQHDETIAAGIIISADPSTPPQLPKGDPVDVVVSDGPAPRTVPTFGPDTTFEQASAALAAVQLKAVKAEEFSDTVPTGKFIRTDPAAGTDAPRDSSVQVVFSKGKQPVPIPDVRGQSVADAADELQKAGFTVTGVQGNPSRTVVGTNPPAGSLAQPGTGVTIITRG